jgi:hypothetical protein
VYSFFCDLFAQILHAKMDGTSKGTFDYGEMSSEKPVLKNTVEYHERPICT